jgi:hypothetical protein
MVGYISKLIVKLENGRNKYSMIYCECYESNGNIFCKKCNGIVSELKYKYNQSIEVIEN